MPVAPSTAPRVLVVEDEVDVAELIKHALERRGDARVDIITRGDTALAAVAQDPPDLLILDLNLPAVDGVEICRRVRSRPATASLPIIMLTARTDEAERIAGLDMGADDYVTKPFSLSELAARVRAVLRRPPASRTSAPAVYRSQDLVADFDAVSVSVAGQPVRLTRREFELLRCLIEHRNRVLSRDRLLERVWGYDSSIETRSVDVHMGRLRMKLGPVAHHLETVVGIGYRFVD